MRCNTDVLLTTLLPGLFKGIVDDERNSYPDFFSRECKNQAGEAFSGFDFEKRVQIHAHVCACWCMYSDMFECEYAVKANKYKDIDIRLVSSDERTKVYYVNRGSIPHASMAAH